MTFFAKEYCSRSEAKRLLSGLDKFSEIVRDFRESESSGKALPTRSSGSSRKAPDITLRTEDAGRTLMPMISHVVGNSTKQQVDS